MSSLVFYLLNMSGGNEIKVERDENGDMVASPTSRLCEKPSTTSSPTISTDMIKQEPQYYCDYEAPPIAPDNNVLSEKLKLREAQRKKMNSIYQKKYRARRKQQQEGLLLSNKAKRKKSNAEYQRDYRARQRAKQEMMSINSETADSSMTAGTSTTADPASTADLSITTSPSTALDPSMIVDTSIDANTSIIAGLSVPTADPSMIAGPSMTAGCSTDNVEVLNNLRMDEMTTGSESPSPGDHERPSKRPRSITSCSSGYQTPSGSSALGSEAETTRLKRELAATQKQLKQMEETISQHVEIRQRIIKVTENEKDILKSQLREARQTIEELQEEVEIARRAQAAAEAGLSHVKLRMQLQDEYAGMGDDENYSRFEGASTASELEEDDAEILKYVKTEGEIVLNDGERSENNPTSQEQSNVWNIDRNGGRKPILRVNPDVLMPKARAAAKARKIHVEEPAGQPPLANDRLSSLDEPPTEDQDPLSTTSMSVDGTPSSPAAGLSSDFTDEVHCLLEKEEQNDGDAALNGQRKGDKLKLVNFGRYYAYLVSERFYDVDWAGEQTRLRGMYVCKRCRAACPNKQRLEDHVWTTHYKGKFFCPQCPNRSTGLSLRTSLHMHVQTKHPTLYQSEAFRNIRNLRQTV